MQKGPSQKARGGSNEQVGGIRSAGNGVIISNGGFVSTGMGGQLSKSGQ